jgi:hypothetical protein
LEIHASFPQKLATIYFGCLRIVNSEKERKKERKKEKKKNPKSII